MEISLENWLREKVDEHERNHDYAIATDSVRAYIDIYNDLKKSEPSLQSDSSPMKQQIEELIKEAEERYEKYIRLRDISDNIDFMQYTVKIHETQFFLSRLKEIAQNI